MNQVRDVQSTMLICLQATTEIRGKRVLLQWAMDNARTVADYKKWLASTQPHVPFSLWGEPLPNYAPEIERNLYKGTMVLMDRIGMRALESAPTERMRDTQWAMKAVVRDEDFDVENIERRVVALKRLEDLLAAQRMQALLHDPDALSFLHGFADEWESSIITVDDAESLSEQAMVAARARADGEDVEQAVYGLLAGIVNPSSVVVHRLC